jgi:chaperonin GroES
VIQVVRDVTEDDSIMSTTLTKPSPAKAQGAKTMANKIRPLEDRVVIQQIEAEEKTAGGIVLPDTAKEKPQRGRVLAVGPGKLLDSGERAPIGVVEGDEVLFGKYSGTDIVVDGEEIKILRETDILAKIVK